MTEYQMADVSETGPRVETIIIPYVGPTLNKIWAGINHWERTKLGNEAHALCKSAMKDIKPFNLPVHLEFTPTLGRVKGKRGKLRQKTAFDCSNYAISNKLIEDALIVAGIIENDSPKFVHSVKTCRPERGLQTFTTLRIIECLHK